MKQARQYSCTSLLLLSFSVFLPIEAFAYIDPGTGATFVGSLAPLIAGFCAAAAAFVVKYFWHPITKMFKKEKVEDNSQENV